MPSALGPRAEQDFLHEAAEMGKDRIAGYDLADDYYAGEHRVKLDERERSFLEASGLSYCENFCETIVDTMVSRLAVRGFASKSKDRREFANELWADNRMDAGQIPIVETAVKLGDSFVIVEPGKPGQKPRIRYNDPRQVKIVYDSGEPLYASKVWATTRRSASNPNGRAIRRMNIYWPDRVEKWMSASSNGDWAPFRDAADDESHVVWWTMNGQEGGEPIGIPVIHFANKAGPHYGRSELTQVIPQQDALNKELVDHFWVMDAQGWPQQWGTGVRLDDIVRHPGSIITSEKEEAKFGQFDAADPTKTISSIESTIKRMASRSRTPLHLMLAGGNLPSGETLKTSESGFDRKGVRFQTENGNRMEDVETIAARVETAFGSSNPPLDERTDCDWEPVESRNEIDEANTAAVKKTIGVSSDTLLEEMGYDPDDERDKRAKETPVVASELLSRARAMQAPTRSEELGGGRQPAQDPANATV
ncbi:MAG TPA: phage portal protein [Thermoleophilaceae bacterium]|nr:phage portal protein [Thermoleophilaceae bacterium]